MSDPARIGSPPGLPDAATRTASIRLAASRFCSDHLWPHVHEMPLPNGRRADLFAMRPDGGFVVIEIKSCRADFAADAKWPEYRAFCDALVFAVDPDFPRDILPMGPGVLIADVTGTAQWRAPEGHALAPARRRALLHRFAAVAATRLAAVNDPRPDREATRAD